MITITLTPDLEAAVAAEAQRRGTTPELLAVNSLRDLFLQENMSDEQEPEGETLYDFLQGYVGTMSGSSESLSEDTGRRFAEGMLKKQQEGRL